MSTEKNIKKEEVKKDAKKEAAKYSDPETLNTTDPQEHMEGPLSSLMHKTGESFDSDEKEARDNEKKLDK